MNYRLKIYGMCSGLGVIALSSMMQHLGTFPEWMCLVILTIGFAVFLDAVFNCGPEEAKP